MTSWLPATASRRSPGTAGSSGRATVPRPTPLRSPYAVLIVEDQSEIADLIRLHLEELPAKVTVASTGREGLAAARKRHHDLIVLDVRLPDSDGLDLCQMLRLEGVSTPILIVSAKGADVDRILGLQLGADDYLAKPFNVAELVARAKALLRRTRYAAANTTPRESRLRVSDVVIDSATRHVTVASRNVELTAKEFELLYLLASQPGRVFTRAQILEALWRSPYEGYEHNVNCHINRLRLKLEHDPRAPRYILTVWGVGYKFAG